MMILLNVDLLRIMNWLNHRRFPLTITWVWEIILIKSWCCLILQNNRSIRVCISSLIGIFISEKWLTSCWRSKHINRETMSSQVWCGRAWWLNLLDIFHLLWSSKMHDAETLPCWRRIHQLLLGRSLWKISGLILNCTGWRFYWLKNTQSLISSRLASINLGGFRQKLIWDIII